MAKMTNKTDETNPGTLDNTLVNQGANTNTPDTEGGEQEGSEGGVDAKDQEIEKLKSDLEEKDKEIESLKADLKKLKSKPEGEAVESTEPKSWETSDGYKFPSKLDAQVHANTLEDKTLKPVK